jgi:outer membrane protein with beta-barrel domain
MRGTVHFLTIFLAALLALAAAQTVRAQDAPVPKIEIFGGYSYMNANIIVSGTRFNLNGASGSVAYNFKNWLGAVADIGVYNQGNVTGNGRSLIVSSYQFGPRLSWRDRNFVPFAQALFGAGHATGTLYTTSLGNGAAPLGANSGFMFTAGAGVDYRINHTIGVRIIQTEYLYSQFLNAATGSNSNHQNNIRISAGVTLSFGER